MSDDLDAEEMREYRGTLTAPGRNSPYRERSVEENLDLFRRMRAGEFADGAQTLRAKIDMAAGNINMRDPAIYRIRKIAHQNTGDAWPIYPMYDYAHCLSDAVEGITHSLCTLEFEDHRPLYDWFVDQRRPAEPSRTVAAAARRRPADAAGQAAADRVLAPQPQLLHHQQAQARAAGERASRRRLGRSAHADLARPAPARLYAGAGCAFWDRVGVTKQNSVIEYAVLEGCVREELDATAPRRMAVLDPLKLVITNLPEDHEETLTLREPSEGRKLRHARGAVLRASCGSSARISPRCRRRAFIASMPDGEVRLRGVGIIKCEQLIKDADGNVIELRCTLDPETRHGLPGADRKVKGTIHWVSAKHAVAAEVRLYDRLFTVADSGQRRATARAGSTISTRRPSASCRRGWNRPRPASRRSSASSSNGSAISSPTASTIAPTRRCSTAP